MYARASFRLCLKHFPLRYTVTASFFQLVVVPAVEILFFGRPVSYILERIKPFAWNFVRLKEIMFERRKNERIGELKLKKQTQRVFEQLEHT